MQLFMAVPMTPSAALSNIDGRRYRRFSPILVLVLVTGNKFIASVIVKNSKRPQWNTRGTLICEKNLKSKTCICRYELPAKEQIW
jgi:hypothetical protein